MNITVYCGASLGNQPEYQQAAVALGRWIAQKTTYLNLWWWQSRIDGSVS